jgi:hypothetical protein
MPRRDEVGNPYQIASTQKDVEQQRGRRESENIFGVKSGKIHLMDILCLNSKRHKNYDH